MIPGIVFAYLALNSKNKERRNAGGVPGGVGVNQMDLRSKTIPKADHHILIDLL